jgi:hypothetical protein
MANPSPKEKRAVLEKLGVLLDVAGTTTPWEEVTNRLYRLPIGTINALIYRVERARAQAFEEGQQHKSGDTTVQSNEQPVAEA